MVREGCDLGLMRREPTEWRHGSWALHPLELDPDYVGPGVALHLPAKESDELGRGQLREPLASHIGGVDRVEPLPPDRHDPDGPEPLDPVPRLSLGLAIRHQERSRLES